MEMLWSDLMPGDKVKFTDECLEYYSIRSAFWMNSVKNKVFVVVKVHCFDNDIVRIVLENYIYEYVDVLHTGYGCGWTLNGPILELVEIC